jgi:molecular chaperone GrpE (heat shock protein)/DNA-binding Xre family transcriptional regulator
MDNAIYQHNQQKLTELVEKAGINNFRELSLRSGVSDRELFRLIYGLIGKISAENLVKLAQTLNITLNELLNYFWSESANFPILSLPEDQSDLTTLQQEYQLLKQQQSNLSEEFQQSVLDLIESWLLQWPTVVTKVAQNPKLPAKSIIPLVKPLENLIKSWGIEAIASVDQEVSYNPQLHQLMEGSATPGELVKVRYVGYQQGEKLLYRAKVSPVEEISPDIE